MLYYISDKFAEYGLTVILTYKENKNKVEVFDFLMSCRALVRDLELNIFNFIKSKYEKLFKMVRNPTKTNYSTTNLDENIMRNRFFKVPDVKT